MKAKKTACSNIILLVMYILMHIFILNIACHMAGQI